MPTPANTWDRYCDITHAAANPPRIEPSLDECGRCLRRWSEHEVVTDSWGDEVRVCPDEEEDWWDTERELAWRRRQAGEL